MIYYVSQDEELESAYKMFRGEQPDEEVKMLAEQGYLFRIVLTQNQLREKLLIFDDGLDDRIIEIMKLFMISSLQKQHADIKITELLYDRAGADPCFAVLTEDGAAGSLDYDQQIYDSIRKDMTENWPEMKDDEIMINTAWAYEKLFKSVAN